MFTCASGMMSTRFVLTCRNFNLGQKSAGKDDRPALLTFRTETSVSLGLNSGSLNMVKLSAGPVFAIEVSDAPKARLSMNCSPVFQVQFEGSWGY